MTARDRRQRSRVPGLVLTPKGEAVVAVLRPPPYEKPEHGLLDFVAVAQCRCGAIFESGSGEAAEGALSLLYEHVAKCDGLDNGGALL